MPEIGRIQATNFQELLTRLGITRNNIPFVLRSEVSPVVLVGGEVTFTAALTPGYRVTDIFSTGVFVAPAASTVLGDTGPLPRGDYRVQIIIAAQEGNLFDIEWRNVDNTVTLVGIRVITSNEARTLTWETRLSIANDNERFRVSNVSAGNVGIIYSVDILARL